jgi:hypothetical protein
VQHSEFELFPQLVLRSVGIKIIVFWDLTPCAFVFRYKRFGEICCLLLQGLNKMGAVDSSEKVITFYEVIRRHAPHLSNNIIKE